MRVKKTTDVDDSSGFDVLSDIHKTLKKGNVDVDFLSNNTLSNVKEWIDTGSYALNAIMSGSVYGGVPVGRVTGLIGPSGVGKTYILSRVMINAMKKGYLPIYLDSENALDKDYVERLGGDVSKITHVSVTTIEETTSIIGKTLDKVIQHNAAVEEKAKQAKERGEPEPQRQKFMIIIDSLANLLTNKEVQDSLDGTMASDMGLRAKLIGAMLRLATNRGATAQVPILFSNHVYDDPSAMYPSLIKKQSGGHKPLYLASILLQLSQNYDKISSTNKNEGSALSEKTTGCNLRVLTAKNRFIVGQLETELYLSYKNGLDRFSGLLDIAVALGVITRSGPRYEMNGEKLGFASDFEKSKEFWDRVLPILDLIIKRETALSCEMPEIEDTPVDEDNNAVEDVK